MDGEKSENSKLQNVSTSSGKTGHVSIMLRTVPMAGTNGQSTVPFPSARPSFRHGKNFPMSGNEIRSRCCGHWLSTKAFHRHLSEHAVSEAEDGQHYQTLMALGMRRCPMCALWCQASMMSGHMRKSHGGVNGRSNDANVGSVKFHRGNGESRPLTPVVVKVNTDEDNFKLAAESVAKQLYGMTDQVKSETAKSSFKVAKTSTAELMSRLKPDAVNPETSSMALSAPTVGKRIILQHVSTNGESATPSVVQRTKFTLFKPSNSANRTTNGLLIKSLSGDGQARGEMVGSAGKLGLAKPGGSIFIENPVLPKFLSKKPIFRISMARKSEMETVLSNEVKEKPFVVGAIDISRQTATKGTSMNQLIQEKVSKLKQRALLSHKPVKLKIPDSMKRAPKITIPKTIVPDVMQDAVPSVFPINGTEENGTLLLGSETETDRASESPFIGTPLAPVKKTKVPKKEVAKKSTVPMTKVTKCENKLKLSSMKKIHNGESKPTSWWNAQLKRDMKVAGKYAKGKKCVQGRKGTMTKKKRGRPRKRAPSEMSEISNPWSDDEFRITDDENEIENRLPESAIDSLSLNVTTGKNAKLSSIAEEVVPTVELDLFTLPSQDDRQMSVLLTEPLNPNFKVFASMNAIFVGDSALGDVTNHQVAYMADNNSVVYVSPAHFLFPNLGGMEESTENVENLVPPSPTAGKGGVGSKLLEGSSLRSLRLPPTKCNVQTPLNVNQNLENKGVKLNMANSLLNDSVNEHGDILTLENTRRGRGRPRKNVSTSSLENVEHFDELLSPDSTGIVTAVHLSTPLLTGRVSSENNNESTSPCLSKRFSSPEKSPSAVYSPKSPLIKNGGHSELKLSLKRPLMNNTAELPARKRCSSGFVTDHHENELIGPCHVDSNSTVSSQEKTWYESGTSELSPDGHLRRTFRDRRPSVKLMESWESTVERAKTLTSLPCLEGGFHGNEEVDVEVTGETSNREWHDRSAKLKAQVLIQDQQSGVTDSMISADVDHHNSIRPRKSPVTLSSPDKQKAVPTSPDREWQARGAKLKAQIKISDLEEQSDDSQDSSQSSLPVVNRLLTGSCSSSKKIPATLAKRATKNMVKSHKSPKHSKNLEDIRIFFKPTKINNRKSVLSVQQIREEYDRRASWLLNYGANVSVSTQLPGTDPFEGFEDSSRQSGLRAKSLQRFVSLLNMKSWYGVGKLPFSLEQLCTWNDFWLTKELVEYR